MMINSKLIRRYSKSLYNVSIELNKLEVIYKEMIFLYSLLLKSNDLKNFFLLSILDIKKKQNIAEKLFFNFSTILKKFIFLLISKKREIYIREIIEEFKKLYNKFNNIVEVDIITASHLNQSVINSIIHNSKLVKHTSNLIINHIVNSNILGGYILSIEGKQVNCTIQLRLSKLKKIFQIDPFI